MFHCYYRCAPIGPHRFRLTGAAECVRCWKLGVTHHAAVAAGRRPSTTLPAAAAAASASGQRSPTVADTPAPPASPANTRISICAVTHVKVMQRTTDGRHHAADNMRRGHGTDHGQVATDNGTACNRQHAACSGQHAAEPCYTCTPRQPLAATRRIGLQPTSSFVVASARRRCAKATRQCASGVPDRVVCMGHLPSGMRHLLPCVIACDWCITPAGDASWRTSCQGPR